LAFVILIGTALWWYTQGRVASLETGLAEERAKIYAADRRVTDLVGALVGVDKFDALGQRVTESEGDIRAISATLYELRKYLDSVSKTQGTNTTIMGTLARDLDALARDLDRDRELRTEMRDLMTKLHDKLDGMQ
jgi:hypothetical protein